MDSLGLEHHRMAIPKFAPLVIIDGIVREISIQTFKEKGSEVATYRGRKVVLLTGRGFVEVKFQPDDDDVIVKEGDRLICFTELSEWKMDSGNSGSTLTYGGPVTTDHLEEMIKELRPAPVAKAN